MATANDQQLAVTLGLQGQPLPHHAILTGRPAFTLASPAGGQPPLDPKSDVPDAQSEATERFKKDGAAQSALAHTTKLAEIDADKFDAIFYAGGHGPLWDLAKNSDSRRIIETFIADNRPLAAVCHAPAIFKHTKRTDGKPVVSGRRVTGFANTEEEGVGLTKIVPFLVENMLKANGGLYEKGPDWGLTWPLMAGSSPGKIPRHQKLRQRRYSSSSLSELPHRDTLSLRKARTSPTIIGKEPNI